MKSRQVLGALALLPVALTLVTGQAGAEGFGAERGPSHYTCNSAAPPDDDTTGGHHTITAAHIRAGSGTNCVSRGLATPNQSLDYHCFTRGNDGYTWTYVVVVQSRARGWIRDDLLNDYGSRTPCPH
jgi:hypothetical protein